jgi:hypothetical protein
VVEVVTGARPQRADNFVSRRVGDEFVLVPICAVPAQMDSLYVLNEVAARTWELLDGTRTVADICTAIVDEFEVDRDEAERDLIDLLRQLEQVAAVELEP